PGSPVRRPDPAYCMNHTWKAGPMTTPNNLSRRLFLQRAAVGTLMATGGSTLLAACAGSGSDNNGSGGSGANKTADNPFGMADKSTVDAVIFNGGYGYDYVTFAADIMQKKHAGSTVKVSPSTQIAQQLQPRFVGGNPPDLIDNSGANQIGFNTIQQQLETLDDVFEANNYEGTKISDTLYPNVKLPGTFGGKFIATNYVMKVYGIWYSASLFQQNDWTVPQTWDEMIALGAKAKAKGKYLLE